MKIRNLYLGLMDQMPLSRFVKNLRKGHVLGLFSKRSHFRSDGQSKVIYNTKETATKSDQRMKEKNKIMELVFKEPTDITISQWIEPEERSHIAVDENSYRILEDVGDALFILEDNLDEGLEAHILIGQGTERAGYSCWAIKQEDSNELNKTWIGEIEKLFVE